MPPNKVDRPSLGAASARGGRFWTTDEDRTLYILFKEYTNFITIPVPGRRVAMPDEIKRDFERLYHRLYPRHDQRGFRHFSDRWVGRFSTKKPPEWHDIDKDTYSNEELNHLDTLRMNVTNAANALNITLIAANPAPPTVRQPPATGPQTQTPALHANAAQPANTTTATNAALQPTSALQPDRSPSSATPAPTTCPTASSTTSPAPVNEGMELDQAFDDGEVVQQAEITPAQSTSAQNTPAETREEKTSLANGRPEVGLVESELRNTVVVPAGQELFLVHKLRDLLDWDKYWDCWNIDEFHSGPIATVIYNGHGIVIKAKIGGKEVNAALCVPAHCYVCQHLIGKQKWTTVKYLRFEDATERVWVDEEGFMEISTLVDGRWTQAKPIALDKALHTTAPVLFGTQISLVHKIRDLLDWNSYWGDYEVDDLRYTFATIPYAGEAVIKVKIGQRMLGGQNVTKCAVCEPEDCKICSKLLGRTMVQTDWTFEWHGRDGSKWFTDVKHPIPFHGRAGAFVKEPDENGMIFLAAGEDGSEDRQ